MGELDLCRDCYGYNPFVEGARAAMLTAFLSWAPLAVAGIILVRTHAVRATMRGAWALRVLARVAITILVAAMAMPLLFTLGFAADVMSLPEGLLFLAVSSAVLSPVLALSAFGIRAWHRVLEELSSHPGEGRLLV
jgi:hypothetical protein